MSIHAGLWQKRSDQAPVFNVIAMKDNEDEQMNDTHINNCFNQTISEFVFLQTCCYWCSQDYRSHSILHLNECDCNWQTSDYEPSWPLSRWLPGRGIVFFSGQTPLPRSPPPYFLAKDLQQLFIGQDSILELAKVHAGKASARLPSKQMLHRGCVRFLSESWFYIKCSVTLKCIFSRKRRSEWILQRHVIPISNFVGICVVVFVFFSAFEVEINVSGHLVHIVANLDILYEETAIQIS